MEIVLLLVGLACIAVAVALGRGVDDERKALRAIGIAASGAVFIVAAVIVAIIT